MNYHVNFPLRVLFAVCFFPTISSCTEGKIIVSGSSSECGSGAVRVCGLPIGVCRTGLQACTSERKWGACEGGVLPGEEVCGTDLDEDCDGLVDEGCDCTEGQTRACGSGIGECRRGHQTCNGGRWGGECVDAILPTNEACNGRDDDCNGVIDNGGNACGGVCVLSMTPGNACDATTDNDLCTDDVLMCSEINGTECVNAGVDVDGDSYSAVSITCGGDCNDEDRLVNPGADEVCDGKDNDCDGVVDNGCAIAFPGAEGYGSGTPGGRGGRVVHVTNLLDYNTAVGEAVVPGSFRYALEAVLVPRIIVFDVSGTIILHDALRVKQPYVTIAGQTAPGQGITLRKRDLQIRTHDVIVRFIRVRVGDEAAYDAQPVGREFLRALLVRDGATNVIFDHCSLSWSVDEEIGMSTVTNFTMQHSLIAESLYSAMHPDPFHHAAAIISNPGCTQLSFHHNVFAHNSMRNPELQSGHVDVRNNVIYDYYDAISTFGSSVAATELNYVGNVALPGPGSASSTAFGVNIVVPGVQVYVFDNRDSHRPTGTGDDWLVVNSVLGSGAQSSQRVSTPFDVAPVTTTPSANLVSSLIDDVGVIVPARDSVDTRVINDVRNGTGGFIDNPSQVGGWPALPEVSRPAGFDTDQDGMPDAWETTNGFNPSVPDDNGDADSDGYTNIEEYLNSLAGS